MGLAQDGVVLGEGFGAVAEVEEGEGDGREGAGRLAVGAVADRVVVEEGEGAEAVLDGAGEDAFPEPAMVLGHVRAVAERIADSLDGEDLPEIDVPRDFLRFPVKLYTQPVDVILGSDLYGDDVGKGSKG